MIFISPSSYHSNVKSQNCGKVWTHIYVKFNMSYRMLKIA